MGENFRKTNCWRSRAKKLGIMCISIVILTVVLYFVGCWILEYVNHPLDSGLRNCIKLMALYVSILQVLLSALLYSSIKFAKKRKIPLSDALRVKLNSFTSWLD